jgi:hypothetical protein
MRSEPVARRVSSLSCDLLAAGEPRSDVWTPAGLGSAWASRIKPTAMFEDRPVDVFNDGDIGVD